MNTPRRRRIHRDFSLENVRRQMRTRGNLHIATGYSGAPNPERSPCCNSMLTVELLALIVPVAATVWLRMKSA